MRAFAALKLTSVVSCMLFAVGCGERSGDPPQNTIIELPAFSIVNKVAGGEFRQVIQVTNGLVLYFTEEDVVVWFGGDSYISIGFDPDTLKPLKSVFRVPASDERPAASVLDINVDGDPDYRRVIGRELREIFYQGEWYPVLEGTNTIMVMGEHHFPVRFDGRRWVRFDERLESENSN
jgi:hypothetical protein